jgi:hypothetical protein
METIHAALLEAGSRIAPLASLDEIAGFFQAAAAIGPTAPARATAVAQRLGGSLVDAASMLASILPTLPSMPNVERLLSVLPPCQDMHLGPTRDTCAVCDNGVLEPSQCFTTAPLISAKGLVKQVQLFKRRCSCCHADHYLSYAAGGLRLQRGEQVPYEGCTDARYLHITTSCVWEASLLVDFEAQALNSHTGFSTFMAEYRMKYGGELPFSDDRAHRAFAHAFYAWSLLRWRLEFGLLSGIVGDLKRIGAIRCVYGKNGDPEGTCRVWLCAIVPDRQTYIIINEMVMRPGGFVPAPATDVTGMLRCESA